MTKRPTIDRRAFLRDMAGSAALLSVAPAATGPAIAKGRAPSIRFAVIGINHGHINSQVTAMVRAGGELVSVFAKEDDLRADFVKRFPQSKAARSEDEILQDASIQLVLSAAIPDERGPARRARDAARQGLHGRQAGH